MTCGKKIGKLVHKCTKVELLLLLVPHRRNSTGSSGRSSSVSSRSSSPRGSSRRGSDNDYWDVVERDDDDDDDEDEDEDEDVAPVGVPEGCLAVYVGPDMRRFVIQASFLSNQVFRELLRRSEEEYGFKTEGGLRIPCEAEDFEKLLWRMENGTS